MTHRVGRIEFGPQSFAVSLAKTLGGGKVLPHDELGALADQVEDLKEALRNLLAEIESESARKFPAALHAQGLLDRLETR